MLGVFPELCDTDNTGRWSCSSVELDHAVNNIWIFKADRWTTDMATRPAGEEVGGDPSLVNNTKRCRATCEGEMSEIKTLSQIAKSSGAALASFMKY